jgi:hypothetical protein
MPRPKGPNIAGLASQPGSSGSLAVAKRHQPLDLGYYLSSKYYQDARDEMIKSIASQYRRTSTWRSRLNRWA